MRPAKVAAIVVGALLLVIGLALLAPGGFLLWAYGTQRDSAGFFETSNRVVSTSAYALTTPNVDINVGPDLGDWIPTGGTAAVRLRAASSGATPVFIGIGPTDRVSQYLANVAHDEVTNFGWWSAAVDYRHVDGGAPASAPSQQDFWVAEQEGMGSQVLQWEVQDGTWTAVIMNGDASAPVTANVSLGARFGVILPIAYGLVVAGLVVLAIGILLIVLGARRPRLARSPQKPPPPETKPTQPETPAAP
ncbi:MAG: hypothetical protein A2133_00280 [Actinobacteria bacterium RBG_16_64_13]|nr:MAG: hypothetical protein A2133_00280 [Actinobacteria bacterium RBG_16_64_13]